MSDKINITDVYLNNSNVNLIQSWCSFVCELKWPYVLTKTCAQTQKTSNPGRDAAFLNSQSDFTPFGITVVS